MGIGVDGCRVGWLAVKLAGRSAWEAGTFPSVAELHAAWGGANTLTLIDIPIGLPDTTSFRACDAAARRYLGRRASSVFNPPTRPALVAGSYREAADRNQEACGKRLSKQTWNIMPKIAEVDRFMGESPDRQEQYREVHPETLFQALNGGRPLDHRKKDPRGREERLTLLASELPVAPAICSALQDRFLRREVALDDILDALAAAVVAERYGQELTTIQAETRRDSTGLRCEMVLPAVVGHAYRTRTE